MEDIYEQWKLDQYVDDDDIDAYVGGFMRGYLEAI
jgi:hypothetical protein